MRKNNENNIGFNWFLLIMSIMIITIVIVGEKIEVKSLFNNTEVVTEFVPYMEHAKVSEVGVAINRDGVTYDIEKSYAPGELLLVIHDTVDSYRALRFEYYIEDDNQNLYDIASLYCGDTFDVDTYVKYIKFQNSMVDDTLYARTYIMMPTM